MPIYKILTFCCAGRVERKSVCAGRFRRAPTWEQPAVGQTVADAEGARDIFADGRSCFGSCQRELFPSRGKPVCRCDESGVPHGLAVQIAG